jgi:hypothetical protein
MISASVFRNQEIDMRTVLAISAIGFISVGYLLSPAVALPRNCYAELEACEAKYERGGYSNSWIQVTCLARQAACWKENERQGLGPNGEGTYAQSTMPKKKKPKSREANPPHFASHGNSGLMGANANLGTANTSSPITVVKSGSASTASSGVSTPTAVTSPPRPATVSTDAIVRERGRVGASRF